MPRPNACFPAAFCGTETPRRRIAGCRVGLSLQPKPDLANPACRGNVMAKSGLLLTALAHRRLFLCKPAKRPPLASVAPSARCAVVRGGSVWLVASAIVMIGRVNNRPQQPLERTQYIMAEGGELFSTNAWVSQLSIKPPSGLPTRRKGCSRLWLITHEMLAANRMKIKKARETRLHQSTSTCRTQSPLLRRSLHQ